MPVHAHVPPYCRQDSGCASYACCLRGLCKTLLFQEVCKPRCGLKLPLRSWDVHRFSFRCIVGHGELARACIAFLSRHNVASQLGESWLLSRMYAANQPREHSTEAWC